MHEPLTPDRAEAITGARNWAAVRARFPEKVDAVAAGLMLGDPAADAVVAEFFSGSGLSWQQTVEAVGHLDHSKALPPALSAFIEASSNFPAWFDPELARAGANAWWRFGSLQTSTLYQSLIYGYQARGFTRPLLETGRLTTGTFDRVNATARWIALATAPGMMAPGAPGWSESLRIRLVHAIVRYHLIEKQGWDVEQFGVPINQAYSQLTITAGFLVLPLRVAKDFGIRYSRADLEAITHLWRWIGWVMGVQDHLLPVNFADAELLQDISRQFALRPDAESRILVRALLDDGFRPELPVPARLNSAIEFLTRPMLRQVFAAVSTRWIEPETAEGMGLKASPLHHLVDLARPMVRSREVARAIGLLGTEHEVAQRELKLVASRIGLDLADLSNFSRRYDNAAEGQLNTVA